MDERGDERGADQIEPPPASSESPPESPDSSPASPESPPPSAPDPTRFADELQEREFLATSEQLLHPPRVQEKSRVLLITLGAFVLSSFAGGRTSITEVAMLVGVLMVHELGHALGMLVFGYSDVRIFFIPLFGAAAAGRKRGVARWKEGVVLLMGPLPGLIAGTLLLLLGSSGLVRTLALQLVAINAFNLLPLAPLDGGQLFQLLVFSRHRHLEIAFQTIASLALAIGGAYLKLWVLAAVGVFMLLMLPIRKQTLAAGTALRTAGLPADPATLDEPQRRTLFAALWAYMPVQWRGKPRAQASHMEALLEIATRRPTGFVVTLGLFIGWVAGVAITVVAVFAFVQGEPARWQRYEDAHHQFWIELPAPPTEASVPSANGAPMQRTLSARLGRSGEYGVSWFSVEAGSGWQTRVRDAFAVNGKQRREVAIGDGPPAQIVEIEGREAWVLVRGEGETGFLVIASGPDEICERVLRSFVVR